MPGDTSWGDHAQNPPGEKSEYEGVEVIRRQKENILFE